MTHRNGRYADPASHRSAAIVKFPQFVNMVRHIHHCQGKKTDDATVTAAAAGVFEKSRMSKETGFITESVFVSASLSGGFSGTEKLFRVLEPSLVDGRFTSQNLESASAQLGGMQISTAATQEGGFAYPEAVRRPTKAEAAAAAAAAARASGTDPLLAIASGGASGSSGSSSGEVGVAAAAGGSGTSISSPMATRAAGGGGGGGTGSRAATPQKSFPVRFSNHAIFDRAGSGPHKAATQRKIVHFDLQSTQSASPAIRAGVEQGILDIARSVTDVVLASNYKCESTQVFGCPPFRLIEEHALKRVLKAAQELFLKDAMVVEVLAPTRVFGDIHGQMPDLLHFFHTYGMPTQKSGGDIDVVNYLFIGDFVDRGTYSLEVVTTLFCLKLQFPHRVFLVRGNHEDAEVNEHFGFKRECTARLKHGEEIWRAVNHVFDNLPVAALIENAIFCVHGGIGKSVVDIDQIRQIPRPLSAPVRGEFQEIMRDLLWSDPTENDNVTGIKGNARGDEMVEFGPDRVKEFLELNGLDLIVRAHQCVPGGYEFFARQHLVTIFSATNYCGRHENDGAILTVTRDLKVLFHVITQQERRPYSLWSQPQNSTPPRTRKPFYNN